MRLRQSYRRIILFILLSVFTGLLSLARSVENGDEYEIKALFVLNFIKYTEWPRPKDRISIGVIGDSEIKRALSDMIEKKYGKDKKFEVFSLNVDDVRQCDIIIISANASNDIEVVSKKYVGKGILIIGDELQNASKGAAINLLNLDNKIRFDIYQSQAKLAGIKISSRLSELARATHP